MPIRYDVLTNIGELKLLVDAPPEEIWSSGGSGDAQELKRGTNGSCLLVWHAIYDSPGKHFLQAMLSLEGPRRHDSEEQEIKGRLLPFQSTNVLQFDSFSMFGEKAFLQARLAESNGTYKIEILNPENQLVKTFTGATSNGLIAVEWDLIDEQGRPYTNDSLDAVYHVTLPDSGRTQTVR